MFILLAAHHPNASIWNDAKTLTLQQNRPAIGMFAQMNIDGMIRYVGPLLKHQQEKQKNHTQIYGVVFPKMLTNLTALNADKKDSAVRSLLPPILDFLEKTSNNFEKKEQLITSFLNHASDKTIAKICVHHSRKSKNEEVKKILQTVLKDKQISEEEVSEAPDAFEPARMPIAQNTVQTLDLEAVIAVPDMTPNPEVDATPEAQAPSDDDADDWIYVD